MPSHNADIAAVFEEIANLLEIEGANPFRIRAYRNAAQAISALSTEAYVLLSPATAPCWIDYIRNSLPRLQNF